MRWVLSIGRGHVLRMMNEKRFRLSSRRNSHTIGYVINVQYSMPSANRQASMALEYKRTWMCIVRTSLSRDLCLRTASYRSINDEPAFLRRSLRVSFPNHLKMSPLAKSIPRHASSVTTSTLGGNTDLKNPFVSGPLLPESVCVCFRSPVTR